MCRQSPEISHRRAPQGQPQARTLKKKNRRSHNVSRALKGETVIHPKSHRRSAELVVRPEQRTPRLKARQTLSRPNDQSPLVLRKVQSAWSHQITRILTMRSRTFRAAPPRSAIVTLMSSPSSSQTQSPLSISVHRLRSSASRMNNHVFKQTCHASTFSCSCGKWLLRRTSGTITCACFHCPGGKRIAIFIHRTPKRDARGAGPAVYVKYAVSSRMSM